MKIRKFEVIIAVGFDVTGIARLPRVLHDAGCRVTLLAPPGLAVQQSRFVDAYIAAPPRMKDFVEALKTHMSGHRPGYEWLIIGDELLLGEIAKHKSESWVEAWFPVDVRTNATELITSKFAFLSAAATANLNVPRLEYCRGIDDGKVLANEIGYPVVLKAEQGFNGAGVRVVPRPSDFEKEYNDLHPGGELAIQKYVTGPVGLTEVLFNCGEPVCWVSSYKRASWPHPNAASCAREVMDHRDIEAIVRGVGKLTGFDGLGGIDWVHDPNTDSLSLIEFNPRPTPGYYLGETAGVSFAAGIESTLSNKPVNKVSQKENRRSKVIHMFPQSTYLAIDRRDLRMLARSLADIPWSDPKLALAYSRRVLTHYLPAGLRQLAKRRLRSGALPLDQKGES
jgi:predicted ATP-grasp superfamily ATP-dependent carboligase